jgi:ABC-type spermidine/putrescine transport system permease subunit II
MENRVQAKPVVSIPAAAESEERSWAEENRGLLIGIGVALVVLLAAAVVAVVFMARNPAATQTIRDIFIIFMALLALIIGVALIIVVVQLALLTNMLRHEIKPILDSTNETARTLRGTATFLSENMVSPVIKAHSKMAAVRSALDLLRPNHRS